MMLMMTMVVTPMMRMVSCRAYTKNTYGTSIWLPTSRYRVAEVAGPKYLSPDVKDEGDGTLQHELQQ